MEPPRKLTRRNLFRRVDVWRQEQRTRRIQEKAENSRRVPRPESAEDRLGDFDVSDENRDVV
jgi:hypothetical protein